jgi:hypothetical protein
MLFVLIAGSEQLLHTALARFKFSFEHRDKKEKSL